MRHHDDLPPELVLPDLPDDQIVDQVVVQVVFRLIQYQRLLTVGEQEGQHRRRPLSRGRLVDRIEIRSVPPAAGLHQQPVFGEPGLHLVEHLGAVLVFCFEMIVEMSTEIAVTCPSGTDSVLDPSDAPFHFPASLRRILRQFVEELCDATLDCTTLFHVEDVTLEVNRSLQRLTQGPFDGSGIVTIMQASDTHEFVVHQRVFQKVVTPSTHRAAGFRHVIEQGARSFDQSVALFLHRIQTGQFGVEPLPLLHQTAVLTRVADAFLAQRLDQCFVLIPRVLDRRLPCATGQFLALRRDESAQTLCDVTQVLSRIAHAGGQCSHDRGNLSIFFRGLVKQPVRQIFGLQRRCRPLNMAGRRFCRIELPARFRALTIAVSVSGQDRGVPRFLEALQFALHVPLLDGEIVAAGQPAFELPDPRFRRIKCLAGFFQVSLQRGHPRRLVDHLQQRPLVFARQRGDLPLAEHANRKALRRDRLCGRWPPTGFARVFLHRRTATVLSPMQAIPDTVAHHGPCNVRRLRQTALVGAIPGYPLESFEGPEGFTVFFQMLQFMSTSCHKPHCMDHGRFAGPASAYQSVEPRAELEPGRLDAPHVPGVLDLYGFDAMLRQRKGLEGVRVVASPDGKPATVQQRQAQPFERWFRHLHPREVRPGEPRTLLSMRMM